MEKVKSQSDQNISNNEVFRVMMMMQEHYSKLANEADKSISLLSKIGEKTPFCKQIENMMLDPFNFAANSSDAVDKMVNQIISDFANVFFNEISKFIETVRYRMNSGDNFVFYVVPKEDNFETRELILSFYRFYSLLEFSNKYPVVMNIIPPSIKSNFSSLNIFK